MAIVLLREYFKKVTPLLVYTGFPNLKTIRALNKFLRPETSGENIRYSSFARDDIQAGHSEHSASQGRPRSLKTIDNVFLTLCLLRQGFAEIHLAHLTCPSQL